MCELKPHKNTSSMLLQKSVNVVYGQKFPEDSGVGGLHIYQQGDSEPEDNDTWRGRHNLKDFDIKATIGKLLVS